MDSESALPGDVQEEMPEEDVADVLGRESHSAWQLALVLVEALVLNENGPQGHCVTKGEMSDIKLTLFSRNLTIFPHHRRVGCPPPILFVFGKGSGVDTIVWRAVIWPPSNADTRQQARSVSFGYTHRIYFTHTRVHMGHPVLLWEASPQERLPLLMLS